MAENLNNWVWEHTGKASALSWEQQGVYSDDACLTWTAAPDLVIS